MKSLECELVRDDGRMFMDRISRVVRDVKRCPGCVDVYDFVRLCREKGLQISKPEVFVRVYWRDER